VNSVIGNSCGYYASCRNDVDTYCIGQEGQQAHRYDPENGFDEAYCRESSLSSEGLTSLGQLLLSQAGKAPSWEQKGKPRPLGRRSV